MDCNYPKYGDLLNLVSPEVRTLYRKYESINKRIIKAKWSATFNRICIKEDIMPVYTRINIYLYRDIDLSLCLTIH